MSNPFQRATQKINDTVEANVPSSNINPFASLVETTDKIGDAYGNAFKQAIANVVNGGGSPAYMQASPLDYYNQGQGAAEEAPTDFGNEEKDTSSITSDRDEKKAKRKQREEQEPNILDLLFPKAYADDGSVNPGDVSAGKLDRNKPAWEQGVFAFAPIEYMLENKGDKTYDQWLIDQYNDNQAKTIGEVASEAPGFFNRFKNNLVETGKQRNAEFMEKPAVTLPQPLSYSFNNPEGLSYDDWVQQMSKAEPGANIIIANPLDVAGDIGTAAIKAFNGEGEDEKKSPDVPDNTSTSDQSKLFNALYYGLDNIRDKMKEQGGADNETVADAIESLKGNVRGTAENPNGSVGNAGSTSAEFAMLPLQSQQYDKFWETDEGKAVLADLIANGYAEDFLVGDQGYYNFLSSMDRDLASRLINSIPTWDARYKAAGVDIDNPDSIYEYMWLNDPIIANAILSTDAYEWGRHGISDEELDRILPYISPEFYMDNRYLNKNDVAQYLYMVGATNGAYKFDLDEYNRLAGSAGDPSLLGFMDEDSSFVKDKPRENRQTYSIVNPQANWYPVDDNETLIDANMIDTAMALAEEQTGRKVGVKGRDAKGSDK